MVMYHVRPFPCCEVTKGKCAHQDQAEYDEFESWMKQLSKLPYRKMAAFIDARFGKSEKVPE